MSLPKSAPPGTQSQDSVSSAPSTLHGETAAPEAKSADQHNGTSSKRPATTATSEPLHNTNVVSKASVLEEKLNVTVSADLENDTTRFDNATSKRHDSATNIDQSSTKQPRRHLDEPYDLEDESTVPFDGDEEEEEDDGESQYAPELNNKRIILQRFTVYNSTSTMYIVGSNAKESLFRILEIDKDPKDETAITIIEDKNFFYTRKDMVDLINGLHESIDGGIHKIAQGYGLLGLINFTKGYYLSIITKCSQVAIIGGHYIYHVDETKLIPLDIDYRRPNKYSDEEKLLSIFKYLDLGKTFYFSYAYDITNTLQTNFIRHKKLATEYKRSGGPKLNPKHPDTFDHFEHNERFVWNRLLLTPILENKDIATYEWFQPIIHGFIDQANISIYGKKIYITIIARRSRHFAGARFLKRGVNYEGNVANEIETEQIVTDMLISSFYDPKYGFYNNPRFTSFVQHRGSIPLYWTQDLNRLPKPPIEISLSDPFYASSAAHFNNLFERYGAPVIILNLIKTKEKTPREAKLNQHFINCVNYLNQFLSEKDKLQFNSFDMSKHSRKNMDVIGPLQEIASRSIEQIGFFHNGVDIETTKVQKGIIRTNCIDCLDRTNAAQFIICKEALSHQLASLGLIPKSTTLAYESDLINILTEIFHDHGDTIAIQYGGSNLVNTMDSYRRINQWSSHTRDMINSIKRIYSNSFMDSIRQEAINLFLGNYKYDPSKPKLWELQNDFYLHNDMTVNNIRFKISYIKWYNERYLRSGRFDITKLVPPNGLDRAFMPYIHETLPPYPDFNDNWFNECYVPRKYQSLTDLFAFNMNSNSRYFPSNLSVSKSFDYSPFESRKIKYDKSVGMNDLKYLDASDLKSDPLSSKTDHESDESDSDASIEATRVPIADANASYAYLNIPNPTKFKNLLTSGMEKLGYTNYQDSNQSRSRYADTLLNDVDFYDEGSETLYAEAPQLSEDDEKMYHKYNNLTCYLQLSEQNRLATSVHSDDHSAFYRKYCNMVNRDESGKAKDILNHFYESIDSNNFMANSKYLGLSEDKLMDLNTKDDYFR